MPYTSQHADSIARLIQAHGAAQAAGAIGSGQAWQQGFNDIGRSVEGGLNRYAQFNEQEPERRLRTAQAAEAERRSTIEKNISDAWTLAGGDPDLAVETLTKGGHASAGMALSKQVDDLRRNEIETQGKQLDYARDRLTYAGQLLPQSPEKLDDELGMNTFRSSYAEVLPQISQVVGKDLAAKMPAPDDPDLVTKVNQIRDWGMTQQQRLQARSYAIQEVQHTMSIAREQRDVLKDGQEFLSRWLPTTSSQEEWDAALQGVRAFVPKEVAKTLADQFGPTFSPEAVQRAATVGLNPEQRLRETTGDVGSSGSDTYNHYRLLAGAKTETLGRPLNKAERAEVWASAAANDRSLRNGGRMDAAQRQAYVEMVLAKPQTWKDLTQTVRGEIAPDLFASGFDFPTDAGAAAVAERWKAGQLTTLSKRIDDLTPEEYEAEERRIENSGRIQLGQKPFTESEWNTFKGKRPAAATSPAVAPPPGVTGTRTEDIQLTPEPRAATPAVPPEVAALLKDLPNNKRIRLTDGSVWKKDASGVVTREP